MDNKNSIQGNPAIGSDWENVSRRIYSQREIDASEQRMMLIGEMVKVRKELGISQKRLENLSGVKQPIIARMEMGRTSPQIDTLLKVLAPLGMTLAMVPLDET